MSAEDFKRILVEAVEADQRYRKAQLQWRMGEELRQERARRHAAEEEDRRRRDEDARIWARMQEEKREREQAERLAEATTAAQLKWQQDEYTAFMNRYNLLHELYTRLGGGPRFREAMRENGFTDGVFTHFSFSQEEKNRVGLLPLHYIRTMCAWGLWPFKPDPLVEMVHAMKDLNNR